MLSIPHPDTKVESSISLSLAFTLFPFRYLAGQDNWVNILERGLICGGKPAQSSWKIHKLHPQQPIHKTQADIYIDTNVSIGWLWDRQFAFGHSAKFCSALHKNAPWSKNEDWRLIKIRYSRAHTHNTDTDFCVVYLFLERLRLVGYLHIISNAVRPWQSVSPCGKRQVFGCVWIQMDRKMESSSRERFEIYSILILNKIVFKNLQKVWLPHSKLFGNT